MIRFDQKLLIRLFISHKRQFAGIVWLTFEGYEGVQVISQIRYSMPRLGSSLEIYGGLLDVRSSVIRKSFLLDQQGCSSHRRLTLSDSWRIYI